MKYDKLIKKSYNQYCKKVLVHPTNVTFSIHELFSSLFSKGYSKKNMFHDKIDQSLAKLEVG